jgi:MoaA/NifB/PqqE/SkfB family radical SAM enzyme
MIRKIKNRLKQYEQVRAIKQRLEITRLKSVYRFGREKFDIERRIANVKRTYYLAYFLEFLCNFRCNYCIQGKIERNEYDRIDVGLVADYLRSRARPKERFLAIIGGEVTINPHFKFLIESLCNDFYITVTTNLGSRLYYKFDEFLEWAGTYKIRWNTSYHPGFMDVDLYIKRVKAMKKAGLEVGQVTSVKGPQLPMEDRRRLESADIDFEYQTFFGLDDKTGELLPKSCEHPDFDYERYRKMCCRQYRKTCTCKTSTRNGHARHLIAPDGKIYNCHHLLYAQKHPLGHISDGWPANLLEPIRCKEYGYCNACDIYDMEVLSVDW